MITYWAPFTGTQCLSNVECELPKVCLLDRRGKLVDWLTIWLAGLWLLSLVDIQRLLTFALLNYAAHGPFNDNA